MTKGYMTKLEYNMAWSKVYLKKFGAIESSERGIWSITEKGESLKKDQMDEVLKKARAKIYKDRKEKLTEQKDDIDSPEDDEEDDEWKVDLLDILKNKISPTGFEKLTQRILRESGFIDVKVTGKSGDGGIDGYGVLKIGLLYFRIAFQCKRYKEAVGSSYIRDFRGAMQGKAEKGLFMTTGRFTSSAKKEAIRDGAPPIDLFDGNDICNLIKDLKLGVEVSTKEHINLKHEFFSRF